MRRTTAPGRTRLALVTMILAAAVGACGGAGPGGGGETTAADAVVVTEPSIRPGATVPAPEESAVLTVTGKISSTNRGGTLQLDPPTLDALGRQQVTVYEPWVRRTLGFQGVWLDDLLHVAEADRGARSLHLSALDGYQIDVSMADVDTGQFFIATRTGDGGPIPIAEGGPLRIVVLDGVPSEDTDSRWIWSLSTIDVR